MIFYAALPAQLSGSLVSPQLAFHPGALLRSARTGDRCAEY